MDGVGQAEFAGEHRPFGAHDVQRQERAGRRGAAAAAARPAETTTCPPRTGRGSRTATPPREVRIPRSTSRPRRIWASRPKNTAASASSSGAHPRYGARSGSPGGGHGKYSAPIPNARSPSSSRCRPSVANTTGSPPSTMIAVVGPSPANRSQRCHSEVMLVSGTGSSRAHHDRLVQRLGVPELGLALGGGFPVRRQQADHRLTAGVGLLQRLLPAFPRPDTGVRVQIQKDLLGQTRLLLDQPRLDRHRLAAIPAGMTQKHPRHTLTALHSSNQQPTAPPSPPPNLRCSPPPPARTGTLVDGRDRRAWRPTPHHQPPKPRRRHGHQPTTAATTHPAQP